MNRLGLTFVSIFFCMAFLLHAAMETQRDDGSESWGYDQVRKGAHLFYQVYISSSKDQHSAKLPTILWAQGGPGISGTGVGNFLEIGPLDARQKKRTCSWLNIANLIFVDIPVGAGFSYVEDERLRPTTDADVIADLMTLLKDVYNKSNTSPNLKELQDSSLYLVGDSYGSKIVAGLALSVQSAVKAGDLDLLLGGVVLVSSWTSPILNALSWGPLLKDLSRLDDIGMQAVNSLARKIQQQLARRQYPNATDTAYEIRSVIQSAANNVDLSNVLLDSWQDPMQDAGPIVKELTTFMNTIVRKKLGIIPDSITWGRLTRDAFNSLRAEFMKPGMKEVNQLLAKGIEVATLNGQLDVISSVKGANNWISRLEWEGLKGFLASKRTPIYFGKQNNTAGFLKTYQNLSQYTILGAGHAVTYDRPCTALKIMAALTNSPAALPPE